MCTPAQHSPRINSYLSMVHCKSDQVYRILRIRLYACTYILQIKDTTSISRKSQVLVK